MEMLHNFIAGKWVESEGDELLNLNPADIRDVVAKFRLASINEVNSAIVAASKAFKSWRKVSAPQRGDILFKVAQLMEQRTDELAQYITRERGKTYSEALSEVMYSVNIFKFYAGEGRRFNGSLIEADSTNIQVQVIKEPLGVILAITPWNFPLSIPSWKIAPAILAGNTVVLKPSSETPLLSIKLMEILKEAGIPDGVVNCVITSGKTINEVILHGDVRAITFTGSNNVGKSIYSAASNDMKRVQLEMGGKNPLIVLEDADIDEAADLAVKGTFGQTGQACTATGRVLVHTQVINEFTEKVVEKTREIKVGNGTDSGVHMGPQVNESERKSTLEYIQSAIQEGAKLLYGGDIPDSPELKNGFFVNPTVLTKINPAMKIAKEEVFGPVLNIIEVQDIDEAIAIANDTKFGLSASVCTKKLDYITKSLNEIEAGLVKINMTTNGTFIQAPFGGYKESSLGTYKELGREAIDFYCRVKTRYIKSF
jgi:acyl-CoA reductase-like NAD-dependent aldehyde dehydrogenase